jgi:hypothetical protein
MKGEVSKVPSWICVTGIPRGWSSDERTEVKDERAETIADSGRWKAGFRLEMMEGVRTRTEGLTGVGAGPGCGCERGRIWRSGRKVCSVRMGCKRRVFRRSERADGASVAIGKEG